MVLIGVRNKLKFFNCQIKQELNDQIKIVLFSHYIYLFVHL